MLLKDKILKITSVFENNTQKLQYSYIENLNDGRGYTFGFCGFTTATGDGVLVIEELAKTEQAVIKYLPELQKLAKEESSSIKNLEGFVSLWKQVGKSKTGIIAQHVVGDTLYWNPSQEYCKQLGLSLPLSQAIIYDTIIQHGEGDDLDGLPALITQTKTLLETPYQEKDFIKIFLSVRRKDLVHPTDDTTRDVWSESVTRVDAFYNLIKSDNWQLTNPIKLFSKDFNTVI